MPKPQHDRMKAKMAERRAKAYDLRTMGKSYPSIAKELGVSAATVRKDIKAYMDYLPRENAIELRDMELDKLNRMELALQKKALGGNTQAINTIVRIMQHRAELMGLDRIENNDGLESAKDAMIQIVNALMQGPDGKPREDTQGD